VDLEMKLGNIATGNDFFNRDSVREDIWRYLADNHLILRGPRRLGKSSLLKRIAEEAEDRGLLVVNIDIGGASTVEQFISSLEQILPDKTVKGYLKKLPEYASAWMDRVGKIDISVAEVKAEINFNSMSAYDWYIRAMDFQQRISDIPVIIQIDEFSVFLEKLLKEDLAEADALLSWMRAWRTGDNVVCRYIYTGSIGINYLLECHQLDTRLNDCYEISLGPFKTKAAKEMIQTLAQRDNWKISSKVSDYLCEKTGWLSPFFINLLLDQSMLAARDRTEELLTEERNIINQDIDDGYERLITSRSRFSHWETRLERHLKEPKLSFCKELLTAIAKSKDGLSLRQLSTRLAKRQPDPDKRQNEIQHLLRKLEDEGYLTPPDDKSRVRFLSFLLRDYWKRNHA